MSIYQVTWKMRFHLQEIRNTFYYETVVGEPSVSEWGDIVDEIRADLVTHFAGGAVPEWVFYAIDARRVDTPGLLSREFLPSLGDLVGSSGSDSTATQIAVLVSVKGTTVKPNRARTYLGGLDETSIVDSLVVVGTRSAVEDLIDEQSVLNSAGVNELQRVAAQWNTSHTMVTVTNNIAGDASKASHVPATQRRRRIGVGI